MKRNWKIIRAILRSENTNQWEDKEVAEHAALCIDAGYLNGRVARGNDALGPIFIYPFGPLLTASGMDMAEILKSAEDLDFVISDFDAKGVGHSSDLMIECMLNRSRKRLATSP